MAIGRGRFPQTYENTAVREALVTIVSEPSRDHFDALMKCVGSGGLVVDVTGSLPNETRLRTLESTNGELILPLFTSLKALHTAVGMASVGSKARISAVIVDAREALGFIHTAEFVAVQFDSGTDHSLVVARTHIEAILA